MVINIGWVKMGQYDKILEEINSPERGLRRSYPESHHRDMSPHRGGEDKDV